MTIQRLLDEECRSRQALPLRVRLGPRAWTLHGEALREALGGEAEIHPVPVPCRAAVPGPAVLLLTADDIGGSHRPALLDEMRRALPGRVIVWGGTDSKAVLLDAINTWHAFRLLARTTPFALLVDAIRQAHAAASVRDAVVRCADDLASRCRELAESVAELERTRAQVVQAERLATVGRLTKVLCAKLDGHYATLDEFVAALGGVSVEEPLDELVEWSVEGVRSIGALLRDMRLLAEEREDEVVLREEELDPLVELAVRLVGLDSNVRRRRLRVACRSGARLRLDRYRLFHVLANLLRNAVEATRPGDTIEVRTAHEGHRVVVEVEDSGVGMSPEVRAQLFTPFFTTKGDEGMGIGLRVSRDTVARQGGHLECTSEPGVGSCFRITFPAIAPEKVGEA